MRCQLLQIGSLADDEKFKDTLWAAICKERGLPSDTSRKEAKTGKDTISDMRFGCCGVICFVILEIFSCSGLPYRTQDIWSVAIVELLTKVSDLQMKLSDHDFNPFDINRAYNPNREGLQSCYFLLVSLPSVLVYSPPRLTPAWLYIYLSRLQRRNR